MILTVDSRREPDELDAMLLDWCSATALPLHLLLTKSDKLKRNAAAQRCGAGGIVSTARAGR